MRQLYVIECRKPDGSLDFLYPQPEVVFGEAAINGIDEDKMAKAIFRRIPDAVMDGRNISAWPALIDPRWSARAKTW